MLEDLVIFFLRHFLGSRCGKCGFKWDIEVSFFWLRLSGWGMEWKLWYVCLRVLRRHMNPYRRRNMMAFCYLDEGFFFYFFFWNCGSYKQFSFFFRTHLCRNGFVAILHIYTHTQTHTYFYFWFPTNIWLHTHIYMDRSIVLLETTTTNAIKSNVCMWWLLLLLLLLVSGWVFGCMSGWFVRWFISAIDDLDFYFVFGSRQYKTL